jgi:NAD(P)-dependent dehydrogenase (short-subunit alcohol dehydrogenase family)
MPSQRGVLAVITGTGGLGFETALALALAGAEVVIAGRNPEKGALAAERVNGGAGRAAATFADLDLADLASIQGFAEALGRRVQAIDLLINNAGVMAPPQRRTTKDGFELQFGTNYLGHFALTGRLLHLLRAAPAARVVTVSSVAHQAGRIRFDDLQGQTGYQPWAAYAQSKLADLMFARELQRRSAAQGWGLISLGAHPGFSRTELIANGPGAKGPMALASRTLGLMVSQSAADGALPILFAATAPEAAPGGYYGPRHAMEMKGPPGPARVSKAARDGGAAKQLWSVSEALTGVHFG